MYQKEKGLTLIEIISVLVVLVHSRRRGPPEIL